jgi:hypothetical protein
MNPRIPEDLLLVAETRWGREDLVPVLEVDGIWLVEVFPHFNMGRHPGDRYVIAVPDHNNLWDGWCCTEAVLENKCLAGEVNVPPDTLALFRKLLQLIS